MTRTTMMMCIVSSAFSSFEIALVRLWCDKRRLQVLSSQCGEYRSLRNLSAGSYRPRLALENSKLLWSAQRRRSRQSSRTACTEWAGCFERRELAGSSYEIVRHGLGADCLEIGDIVSIPWPPPHRGSAPHGFAPRRHRSACTCRKLRSAKKGSAPGRLKGALQLVDLCCPLSQHSEENIRLK